MGELVTETDTRTARVVAVGTYDVSPETLWRVFAERALIERWYGPESAPATFETHELVPGAVSRYRLAAAEGAQRSCYLQIIGVEPARRLEFIDGYGDEAGVAGQEVLQAVVELEPTSRGTRMTVTENFAHRNRMDQLMLGRIDGVLSALSQPLS